MPYNKTYSSTYCYIMSKYTPLVGEFLESLTVLDVGNVSLVLRVVAVVFGGTNRHYQ